MVREGGDGAARGRLDEDLVGLSELAAADANLRAALAGVLRVVDEVWRVASAGQRAAPALQARLMLAVQHAADVSVAVTSVAHRLSGGAAAYAGHRVLASLRDVETARQHILFSHQLRPALMRIASGVQGVVPPFVV